MAEGARDFPPRGVAVRVEDAVAAVRAFAGEQQLRSPPVESGAPFDQLLNGGGSVLNQRSNGVDVTQAVSRVESVLFVKIDLVIVVQGGGDSALRIFRRGLAKAVFCDYKHAARGGELDGGPQACHTCSDHNEIRVNALEGGGDNPWYNGSTCLPSKSARRTARIRAWCGAAS